MATPIVTPKQNPKRPRNGIPGQHAGPLITGNAGAVKRFYISGLAKYPASSRIYRAWRVAGDRGVESHIMGPKECPMTTAPRARKAAPAPDTLHRPSLDAAEVEKFSRMAAEWWDPKGKFGVLHVFNPVRIAYIREQVAARMHRDPLLDRPFEGLTLLDIGCGGGLLAEPMARAGFAAPGGDPAGKNIKTASGPADEQPLPITYRQGTAEDLAAAGQAFDVILNMEVIEHVADPAGFVKTCASMLKPGGLMVMATLNRTLKAFGLAIIGAEYVLHWLPKGTHHWEKFITPEELTGWLQANHCTVKSTAGVTFHPLANEWRRSSDMAVNYMLVAQKDKPAA